MAGETSTVRGLGSGQPPVATGARETLGKDDFLKLFLAQLGHQDPTAPTDSGAFVAQLAQFSSVELLQHANDRLDSLLVAEAAANATGAALLAGRQVSWRTDAVTLGAEGATLHATLGSSATGLTWTITDKSGRTVRTITGGPSGAGAVNTTWDGRDDHGNPLPPGDYKLSIAATGADGAPVEASTRGQGRVEAVTFEAGYPQLRIGGTTVSMSDVTQVAAP